MKKNWYLIIYKHYIDTPIVKYIEDCTEEEMLEKINPIVDAKDFHTISRVIFFDEDYKYTDKMWYLIRTEFKKVKFGEYYSEDLIYNALQTYSDLHRNDDFNEPFIATGYKSIGDEWGGVEIQINKPGDAARLKIGDKISDWCEIHYTNEDEPEAYIVYDYVEYELSSFRKYLK